MDAWNARWNQNPWYPPAPPPGPAHPHVYFPPAPAPGAYPWAWQPEMARPQYHNAEVYRSRKYPDLNPILASDTALLRFDVRSRPHESILSSTFHANRIAPATANPVSQMRLISNAFPWVIDIKLPPGSPITCEIIWDAIYSALKEPLADSEWGIIMSDKSKRETIEKAAKHRERKDGEKKLKRIDWLGDKTMFKGLDKDADFEKQRLLPGMSSVAETWVVKLGSA